MRLSPPSYCEKGISLHEAAHAVLSCILDDASFFPSSAQINDDTGTWQGVVHFFDSVPSRPDKETTLPHEWQQAVRNAWASLIEIYSGAAAARRYTGETLDAAGIRNDPGCTFGDEGAARKLAAHFWPEQHRETILNAAASIAGQLVQQQSIWGAINAVADMITNSYGLTIRTAQIEAAVRQFTPMPVPCPKTEWALSLLDG